MCAELITVPEAYCNYSLDVCLQALGPCRVGLMPAMLGLVYVAVWIDPQPQSRAQRWPTSCCKHLRHHTAVRVPACVYIYVCKHVCNRSMYLWLDAKPQHKTGHPHWTALFWTWSRKLALLGCQLQTGWMNSLICRCHAVCFILCSCCPMKYSFYWSLWLSRNNHLINCYCKWINRKWITNNSDSSLSF